MQEETFKRLTGTFLVCKKPSDTLTKGKKYYVKGHFRYKKGYGKGKERYYQFYEFVTVKNDSGWTVKVNIERFEK